ncbi:hypothetical protein ACFE04_018468 [Oxalis oulophora]
MSQIELKDVILQEKEKLGEMDGGDLSGVVPCSSLAFDGMLRVGTAGAIWGLCSGPHEARKLGLNGIAQASFVAKSVGKFSLQCGMVAGVFTMTQCAEYEYIEVSKVLDYGIVIRIRHLRVSNVLGDAFDMGECQLRVCFAKSKTQDVGFHWSFRNLVEAQDILLDSTMLGFWMNALIGGAVAGAVVAAGTRSWMQVIGMAGLVSAFSTVADYSKTN